jgi:hypothetical protein
MARVSGLRRSAGRAVLSALAWLAACIAVSMAAPAKAVDDVAQREAHEISALIEALGNSGCQFWRNGSWHDGVDARDHLRRKYEWARKRHLAGSAEAFIERAASRSSLSGKPYRVRCPGRPEVESQRWFHEVLRRIRVDDA